MSYMIPNAALVLWFMFDWSHDSSLVKCEFCVGNISNDLMFELKVFIIEGIMIMQLILLNVYDTVLQIFPPLFMF